MRRLEASRPTRPILALAVLALVAGCDSTITTPPSLAGAYTLWAALDPTADVQTVRVIRVADTLVVRGAERLPITVTSTDLNTGVSTEWRDSLVAFRDGSLGHVFGARLRPAYGSRHRVVVRRNADGGEVTAETTVPPPVVPLVLPNSANFGTRLPVVWAGAPQLGRLRIVYVIRKFNVLVAGGYEGGSICDLDSVSYPLVASPGRVGPDWITNIELNKDRDRIYQELAEKPSPNVPPGAPDRRWELGVRSIRVTAEVLSENWRPPGGIFDFEVLAASDAFRNVTGGFGFVGSGYRSGIKFFPTPRDLERAGFFDADAACAAYNTIPNLR